MLNNIKSKIKAFVFDFDGTIKSSKEPECLPLELIKKIIINNKSVGIVTASGVSALSGLAEQIIKLCIENDFTVPVYLGIANGMALYKLSNKGKEELYNYSISFDDTKKIIEVWKKVFNNIGLKDIDLMENGINTFKEFLVKDWGKYIPSEFLSLSKEYGGKCFVEKLKSTLVMPKNDVVLQDKFIALIQEELDNCFGKEKFIIDMGDDVFAHVTKRPNMAPKLFALKRIIKELDLKNDQIVTFGDMPFGNDRGLLIDSGLPYTFTNKSVGEKESNTPPFVLPGSELSPVANVYKAVDSLLN